MKSLYIIVAGALWGTVGLLAEVLFSCGLNVGEIAFIRFFLSSLFLSAFLFIKDKKLFKIRAKDLWLFALLGAFNFLTTFCYYNCIRVSGGALACVLLYSSPVFVLAYLIAFKGKKITLLSLLSVITCVCSCAFASDVFSASVSSVGLLWGLGSAVCNGAVTLLAKELTEREYNGLTVACYSFAFGSLTAFSFSGGINIKGLINEGNLPASLLIVLGGTVIPYSLYFISLKEAEEERAVVLSSVEPIVATLLESLSLRVLPSVNVIIGLIGVFISVFVAGIKDKNLAKSNAI